MIKYTGHIALILSISIGAYLLIDKLNSRKHKISIIQMEKLVYDYQGMKDATKKYTTKLEAWNTQADSLESRLKNLYNEIQVDSINGNRNKLIKDQQTFYLLQKSYYEFKQNVSQKAKQEDEEMTIGVINQLREHIENYSKENKVDLVIANTQWENVGYVDHEMDITQQLLEYANLKYEGE